MDVPPMVKCGNKVHYYLQEEAWEENGRTPLHGLCPMDKRDIFCSISGNNKTHSPELIEIGTKRFYESVSHEFQKWCRMWQIPATIQNLEWNLVNVALDTFIQSVCTGPSICIPGEPVFISFTFLPNQVSVFYAEFGALIGPQCKSLTFQNCLNLVDYSLSGPQVS